MIKHGRHAMETMLQSLYLATWNTHHLNIILSTLIVGV